MRLDECFALQHSPNEYRTRNIYDFFKKGFRPARHDIGGIGTTYRAHAPNGTVSFSFGVDTVPIYDLSGSFQIDQTMIGAGGAEVGLSYSVDLTEDVRGTLTGSGETLLVVGNDFVAAAYTVRGKISRVADVTRVLLTVRLTGEDVIAGVSTPFNIQLVYTLAITPETRTLDGTVRGSARFGQLGSSRIHSDVSIGLPGNADGGWTLQMNIVPLNQLAGSALIVLSNGRVLQAHLGGHYSVRLDQSTVHVTGFGDSRGNSATVVFATDVSFLQGQVFGQAVRQQFVTEESAVR